MNSFYLYNTKNILRLIIFLSILNIPLFFLNIEYFVVIPIFFVIILSVYCYSMLKKIVKIFNKFDDILDQQNILLKNDVYQGKHFIDNLEFLEENLQKHNSTKNIYDEERVILDNIFKVLMLWKSGDLEARIQIPIANDNRMMLQFINALNDLIDEVDAYIRESLGAMEALSRKQFYRTIVKKGLLGAFLIGAVKVNEGLVNFGKKNTEFIIILKKHIQEMISLIVNEGDKINQSFLDTVDFCKVTSTKSVTATQEAKSTYSGLLSIEQLALDLKTSGFNILDIVRDANELTQDGSEKLEKTTSIVAELKTRSIAIHGIVEMIREVAQKTNILSINAAIEAARAGKEGSGFRIVADEVRSLAHTTMASVEDIARQIDAIQEAIQETVSSVSHFTKTMSNIGSISGTIYGKIDGQKNVIDDMSNKIRVFSLTMQNLIENVENVHQSSIAAQSSSQNISTIFKELNQNIFVLEGSISNNIKNMG